MENENKLIYQNQTNKLKTTIAIIKYKTKPTSVNGRNYNIL